MLMFRVYLLRLAHERAVLHCVPLQAAQSAAHRPLLPLLPRLCCPAFDRSGVLHSLHWQGLVMTPVCAMQMQRDSHAIRHKLHTGVPLHSITCAAWAAAQRSASPWSICGVRTCICGVHSVAKYQAQLSTRAKEDTH